jgi:hypothetical protein
LRHSFIEHLGRSRALGSAAALLITCVALCGNAAFARVDSGLAGGVSAALSEDARATVTGGGTVFANAVDPTTVASFGMKARRPNGFVSGGAAEGRINYDRHTNGADRHVNVPVVYMQASPTPEPPNQTGGDALLLADCTNATCPSGTGFVIVYVKDVADSGAGQDVFNIYFCSGAFQPPSGFVPGAMIPGCDPPEGGALRSGNVQIRGEDR